MQTDPDHATDTTPPPMDEKDYEKFKETTQAPADMEEARPFEKGQFDEEEPQEAREDPEAPGRPKTGSQD